MKRSKRGIATQLAHVGRDPKRQFGAVNPPVVRASTFLFDSVATYEARKSRERRKDQYVYGRIGTPTTVALETAVAELEGAADCLVTASGAGAIAVALLATLRAGDHLLLIDCCYEPARIFADKALSRLGVATTYFDPLVGAGIESLIRPETRVIYLETPGSMTFEVPDLRAIASVAKRHGIVTVVDSTWASPLGLRPLELGIDIVVHAGTKHVAGHSDAMLGLVCSNAAHQEALRAQQIMLGQTCGSEEAFLGLRGLRTLGLRLKQSSESALVVARWLQQRPEVARVLYPPLPQDPGHSLWRRDFTGACGLFGVVLAKPYTASAVAAMIEGYELFGLGVSWGGFESLVLPGHPERVRSAVPWQAPGPLVRYAIGLEDPDDLIADLASGFERLAGTA